MSGFQMFILSLIIGIPFIAVIVCCIKTERDENQRFKSVIPGSIWEYKNQFTSNRYKDPFYTGPITVRKILERKTNEYGIDFVKYVSGYMLNGKEAIFNECDTKTNTIFNFLKVHERIEKDKNKS